MSKSKKNHSVMNLSPSTLDRNSNRVVRLPIKRLSRPTRLYIRSRVQTLRPAPTRTNSTSSPYPPPLRRSRRPLLLLFADRSANKVLTAAAVTMITAPLAGILASTVTAVHFIRDDCCRRQNAVGWRRVGVQSGCAAAAAEASALLDEAFDQGPESREAGAHQADGGFDHGPEVHVARYP